MGRGAIDKLYVFTGARSSGVSQAQMQDVHEGALAIGLRSELVPVETVSLARFAADRQSERCLIVDGNQRIKLGPGLAKVSLMVDHPFARVDDLRVGDPEGTVLAWVDESHLAACRTLRVPYRSGFLAHAGPEPRPAPLPAAARDYDICFAGWLAEPYTVESWRQQNPNLPPVVTDLVFTLVDQIHRTGRPVVPLLLEVAGGLGIDVARQIPVEAVCQLVASVQQCAEVNRRVEVLSTLAGRFRVAVASNHLPIALKDRSNLHYVNHTEDFGAIRDLMGNSRIVLNTTCKFPEGAHERLWYGLAEGALPLTDPSTYVARDFAEDETMLYLPAGGGIGDLPERLADLLSHPGRLDRNVEGARAIYAARHTWRRRIVELLALAADHGGGIGPIQDGR